MSTSARDSGSVELVAENEIAIELPSQPPPSMTTSDLRDSQFPGHHLPEGQVLHTELCISVVPPVYAAIHHACTDLNDLTWH